MIIMRILEGGGWGRDRRREEIEGEGKRGGGGRDRGRKSESSVNRKDGGGREREKERRRGEESKSNIEAMREGEG